MQADGSRDKRHPSHHGWNSLSLKVLVRALRVSYRGWGVLFLMADNLVLILLSPTSSVGVKQHSRTEIAFLMSVSSFSLSPAMMLLPQ